MSFNQQETARYARHYSLPKFGLEGQRKLKNASVLCIGAGGLGSPVLLYLAAAGVGKIGIVDFDVVDDSNLQRQVLYGVDDVGKPKAETAKKRLLNLNPHIEVEVHPVQLTSDNAIELFKQYDVVADGTDNFPTRYLVNDACVFTGKPNVYASIFQFEGQVSVFNYEFEDGKRGPNYRDLFPDPPPPGLVPNCAEGGVLGVLPGIIGSMQAAEVIKVITGIGEPLVGRFFTLDAASFETRTLKIRKDPTNPISGENPTQTELIDYQMFCGIGQDENEDEEVKEISVSELKELLDSKADVQVIDVREPYEYEIVNIGAELIPLNSILGEVEKISKDKQVVIHCRSGKRSANAIQLLEVEHGFENLYNLKGGVLAYADEIDTSLTKY